MDASGTLDPPLLLDASVLWMPPGARRFCGRHEWGGQVAYASQFDTPVDRAHRGKAKIKARLIGDRDPDEWDLPPKPKWMRWHTYNKQVDKFDHYEGMLEHPLPTSTDAHFEKGLGKRFRLRTNRRAH